jgi:hypothetical protein
MSNYNPGTDCSGPPDHTQYQGDDGEDEQNMNDPPGAVYKKAEYPSND